MSIAAEYYHIYSASTESCSMKKSSVAEAERTWFCRACNSPEPNTRVVDVIIEESSLGKGPLEVVFGGGVALARLDFLLEFGEDTVKKYLWLGRVTLGGGVEASGWVTFRGKQRLIVRGTNSVAHRSCRQCGQFIYYAAGSRYLCPSPRENVEIFESDLCGLVLGRELFRRVQLRKWTKLYIEKLPVRTKPRDGLPVVLGEI